MLPIDQADDVQLGIRRPGNDDIVRLDVGMADAEMTEGRRRDAEIVAQVLNVFRR